MHFMKTIHFVQYNGAIEKRGHSQLDILTYHFTITVLVPPLSLLYSKLHLNRIYGHLG